MPSACSSSSSGCGTEAVEAPAREYVEAAPPSRVARLVECRPAILRAADAAVDVLGGCSLARRDVSVGPRQAGSRLLVTAAAPDGGRVWVESITSLVSAGGALVDSQSDSQTDGPVRTSEPRDGRESQRNRTSGLQWTPADGACGDS
jgi:hypothetical protein